MGPREFLTYVREQQDRRPNAWVVAIGGAKVGYLALLVDMVRGDYTVLGTPTQDPHDAAVNKPYSFSGRGKRVDRSGRYADLEGHSWGWVHVRTNDVTVSIPGNTHDGLGPKFDDGWPDPNLSMEYRHPEMVDYPDGQIAQAEAAEAADTANPPTDTVQ
ncbi:MAG TPA: hypothetical protein VGO07_06720 [Candidatus Saccharimonadales bacterium]|jgi:hypothetical protein|nr:hypothetical protein [Candidatus Saccharimonadales bacterium]